MFRSVRFNPLLANSKPIVKRTTSNPHVYQIRKLRLSSSQIEEMNYRPASTILPRANPIQTGKLEVLLSNLKTKAKTTDSNNCDASYLRGSKARIVDETTRYQKELRWRLDVTGVEGDIKTSKCLQPPHYGAVIMVKEACLIVSLPSWDLIPTPWFQVGLHHFMLNCMFIFIFQ